MMTRLENSVLSLLMVAFMGLTLVATPTVAQDDVAIEVNGEVVEKSKIQSQVDRMTERMQQRYGEQMEGQDAQDRLREQARQQVIDQTVNRLVLRTNAQEAGISVSGEEVEQELQSTIERFPSEEAFEKAIQQEDMTKDDLRDQIRKSLVVQKFTEQEIGEVSVSDEEARSFYQQNQKRFQDQSFEDVKETIKRSLEQRKQQEQRQALVSDLKEDSEIDIRI